ncbi:MAG TPA: TPM domain-containing protein [Candidatus Limnocylindrales bacterium]|nr:TPM domain-containing protein [Candidatus Limnocylindrales bacterium]
MLSLALSATALAVDVPRLDGAVTDQTGQLAGATSDIETALDGVLQEDGVQLFVLFVPTTGDMTATEFADETARVNSLGGDDALLLVAVEDRTDAIWVSNALPVTDDEINGVIVDTLEPGLRDGDFPAAVIATAQALGAVATSEPAPQETKDTGPEPTFPPIVSPPTNQPGDGLGLAGLVGLVLVALGLVSVGVWGMSRLASWREAEERDRRTGKLARTANAQLIALDDRIRAADQEAGFVEAQFGAEEATPLRAAVSAAKGELGGAFEIRQRLDDDQPEDPPTREAMLNDILERLGRAGAALDAQAKRIDELRNLDREAPSILASLPDQVATQEARIPAATATLRDLTTAYAEPAWAAIRGNVEEATKGLAGARAAIERGTAAVTAGGAGANGPARQIVTAQQGIAGARALLDAIEAAARTIHDTEAALAGQLEAAANDIAAARAAVPKDRPDGTPPHDGEFDAAEASLRTARSAVGATPPEPIGAGRATAAAARLASQLLATVRADAEQQARFVASLDATFRAAHAEVDRASDFIGTRRSGVGRRARTRIAEAERLLGVAEARRDADPRQAMADAQRADDLAGEAYSLASADFARWDQPGSQGGGSGGGSDLGGAILGGIIGGILSGGGGRGGGGWGGSPWGSSGPSFPGGGSSGGWGGGHSMGGGFGGFGGGGSGGGGGGHSQGGHW